MNHLKAVVCLVAVFLVTCVGTLNAQQDFKEILQRSRDYYEIVRQAEAYFDSIPQRSRNILEDETERRDDDWVKFKRWQSFWKDHLNPDGTLGDITAHFLQEAKQNGSEKTVNPYENVPWTNISYTDYIGSQIGLGRTTSMAFHPTNPDVFYVGAAIGGVWQTTDGGQSYVPMGDELPFMAVSSIVVNQQNPSTLYIALSDHVWYGPSGIGVYKSTSGGSSWAPTSLTFNFEDGVYIYWLEADPSNPDHLLAATSDGLYRTTDGFLNYTRVLNVNCFNVRFKPDDPNIVYVGTNNGRVYRSTNNGASFSLAATLGSGAVYLAVSPLDNQRVYARNGSSLYKSIDAGASFASGGSFMEGSEVFVFSPQNANVLLSGNFETYRSNDDGATFVKTMQWLGSGGLPAIHVDQRNMFVNPLENDCVYYCNDGGIYRFILANNSFENLSDGLAITQFYDIAVAQTNANVVSGGSQDNGNVYRDNSGNWVYFAGTGDGMNQDIDPTNDTYRYWEYQNGGLRRWQNGSNTSIEPPGHGSAAWETPFKLDPSNSSRIVVAYTQVYESFNRGTTWNSISGVLAGGNPLEQLAIAPSNGERIYAVRGSSLYVKSTTSDTWTSRSLPAGNISDIEVDFLDMDKVYITTTGYSDGFKIFVSNDAGATWTNISYNLPNVSTGGLELYSEIEGAVFVGTDAGVFYKDDYLAEWVEYGQLPHTRIEDIEIQYNAGLIRVGTHGRGVLEAPIEVEICTVGSPDSDVDGICDFIDLCPGFDNNLIGTPCDDSDPYSSGEMYVSSCECLGGQANLTYCGAEGSAGTGADYLSNVTLNTINNSSGQSNYSDYRSLSTKLDYSTDYPLTVRFNYSFSIDRAHAWIDWNRNGTFDETEKITLSAPDSNHKCYGTVSIPAGTNPGATTMRVRGVYSTSDDEPCGSYFGEVEDYTITVNCNDPGQDCELSSLPIEYQSFSAFPLGKGKAILEWSTASSADMSHFLIERSLNGKDFAIIGQAEVRNSSSLQAYQFVDESIMGTFAYYRIRAVDYSGKSDLSAIRLVKWDFSADNEAIIYPNPASDGRIFVQWLNTVEVETRWYLYNSFGQEVRSGTMPASSTNTPFQIDASGLQSSVYLLRLRTKDSDWSGFVVF